jgi:glycosyltransferase involved in cell wall biosynthesis
MSVIGFDAFMIPYPRKRGWGVYSQELLQALISIDKDNKYICLYNFFRKGNRNLILRPKGHSNFAVKRIPLPGRILDKLWLKHEWPDIDLFTGRIDIFHSPFERLPPKKTGASVFTVHDVKYLIRPDKVDNAFAELSKRKLEKAIERADIIIADSKSTAINLQELYKISSSALRVIWCGVASHFKQKPPSRVSAIRKQLGIGDVPYFLFVGSPDIHKNLDNLIYAIKILKERSLEFRLIIAGHLGWGMKRIKDIVSKEGLEQQVLFPGYIQDSDLPAFYTGAQALCLISFHEGFGLPVVEAAKCACPSIISNCSSLPEIGGEGSIAVSPNDLDAIAEALIQLLDQSTRDNLSRKAEKQGRLFSWSKCAEQVVQVYKELSP